MTDKNSPPGKDQNPLPQSAGGKKPHATLDLKATEVKAPAPGTGSPELGKEKEDKEKSAGLAAGSAASAQPKAAAAGAGDKDKTGSEKSGAEKSQDASKAGQTASASGKNSGGTKPDPKSGETVKSAAKAGPPPKQRSEIGSFFTHLAAGLVGGFLALLGADALQPQISDLKSSLGLSDAAETSEDRVATLVDRLTTLEARSESVAAGEKAVDQKLAGLESRLTELGSLPDNFAALKKSQDELSQETTRLAEQANQGAPGSSVDAERIAKLEQQLSTMTAFAESNENSGVVPRLAALTGRMADLEETLKNQIAAVRSSISEGVEERVGKIAETSEAARSATQRMDRQMANLAEDTARLGQQLETVKADTGRLDDTLRAVKEETGTLASRLQGFEGDINAKIAKLASPADVEQAVKPVVQQVGSLESRVANVVSAEEDRAQNAKRIVLALDLGNLKRAIERGDEFTDELAQVEKTADGLIDVSKLERYGATGVVPVAQLQAMFKPLAHKIIEASSAPTGGSVFDQLLANARSVVKVRKVSHDASDTSAEAVVSRMEEALEAGRLADVLSLAQGLPEGGKQAASAWLAKVEARQAVDKVLASIEDQLKASLSGTN
jgi:hypothetical protein